MVRTQIYLTERERLALRVLGAQLGRTQSDLIREAVDRLIEDYQGGSRLALLGQARGIWSQRQDLPDFDALRQELDRIASPPDEG